MNYTYKIVIKPWYPSYMIWRAPANTEDWEMVSNGASTHPVVKRLIEQEVSKMFSKEDK